MMIQKAVTLLVSIFVGSSLALDNGLSRTPALGYNTWNKWGANINEDIIIQTADLLVSSGLRDAGYKYLVIDDAWSNRFRNQHGEVEANFQKFPNGIKKISDYIHSKGLLLGMYRLELQGMKNPACFDAGALTCLGYPGSRGFEKEDALTFAGFGVDYLKYDNCWAPASDWIINRYTAMRDALNATGRHIVFSMCNWGVANPWHWGHKVGNSWRTTEDIAANWNSILVNLDNTVGLSRYAGPGGWNDPDILEVGNGDLTENEQRSHFALWALLKSPLMVGTDLAQLPPNLYKILLAKEVIAVNQDPLGVAGDLVAKEGPEEVYAGPLKGGARAVVLFNRLFTELAKEPRVVAERHMFGTQYPISNITVRWKDIGLGKNVHAKVRDLFAETNLGTFRGAITLPVDLHDARMLKIDPVKSDVELENWRPWTVEELDDFDMDNSATS